MLINILTRVLGATLILVGLPVFTGGGILVAIGTLTNSDLIGTFLFISGVTTVLTGLSMILKPHNEN